MLDLVEIGVLETLGGIIGGWLVYRVLHWYCTERPEIRCQPTKENKEFLERCKTLQDGYTSPLWGAGQAQTMYNSVLRKYPKQKFRREEIIAQDGHKIVVDWLEQEKFAPNAPILVIVPGICNSSESHYIRHFAKASRDRGYRVAVFTCRGVLEEYDLVSPKIFTWGGTEDLKDMVDSIKKRFPDAPKFGIGFSMGANILAKFVGEYSKETHGLICAVSISQGYEGSKGMDYLVTRPFYDGFLLKKMKRVLKRHENVFKTKVDVDWIIQNVKTVREFDYHLTCKTHDITLEQYYKTNSSLYYLHKTDIPLLLVNSLDDPLAACSLIPFEAPDQNDKVILVTTKHGGHISWLEGVFFPSFLETHWHERLAVEFCESVYAHLQASNKKN